MEESQAVNPGMTSVDGQDEVKYTDNNTGVVSKQHFASASVYKEGAESLLPISPLSPLSASPSVLVE